MARIVIIADDLTGALDSSVPFADRGMGVIVGLDAGCLASLMATEADVVSVSTNTRETTPGDAEQAMAEAGEALRGFDGIVFKKVDSRLKGPIAAELARLRFATPVEG